MARIGLVSQFDIDSGWARSTVLHHMARAVGETCGEVVPYGPVSLWTDRLRGFLATASRKLGPAKVYSPHYSLRRSRELERVFRARFQRQPSDLVFAPKGSVSLGFLELPVPVVYQSDATFALLEGYYASASGFCTRSIRAAHELERRSMQRADALVFNTRWAADSAIRDYGADPARVFVIPTGPNLDPAELPSREARLGRTLDGGCRLLFLGVDWKRKGGAVAFEALLELTRLGVDAELIVCGCEPPAGVAHPRLRTLGYLSKGDPRQREQLMTLFREASFLLVPTRAECFGSVFAEANAWGIPSLATHTGGVPEVVAEGVNGFTFPLDAPGEVYAARIAELVDAPQRYAALVRGCLERYEGELSWSAWGARFASDVALPLLSSAALKG